MLNFVSSARPIGKVNHFELKSEKEEVALILLARTFFFIESKIFLTQGLESCLVVPRCHRAQCTLREDNPSLISQRSRGLCRSAQESHTEDGTLATTYKFQILVVWSALSLL